jgi:signal transduction histidine kinase
MGPLVPVVHGITSVYLYARLALGGGMGTPVDTGWFLLYLVAAIAPEVVRNGRHKAILLALGSFAFAALDPRFLLLVPFHVARVLAVLRVPVPAAWVALGVSLLAIPGGLRTEGVALAAALCAAHAILLRAATSAQDRETTMALLERDKAALEAEVSRHSRLDVDRGFLARLEERKRIAQKLHDGLGHVLAGGITQLEAAQTIVERDPGSAAEMMGAVNAALRTGMDDVRAELRALRPGAEELGRQGIVTMLAEFEARSGVETRVRFNAIDLGPRLWRVVGDNLREALTNTLKHGRASQVEVSVTAMRKLLKVEVRDNGDGLPGRPRPGLGLSGMEERTREAGGTLVVDASQGFSVVMLFPREES